MNITLEQTNIACPEQYDVFIDGDRAGFLRLRHGYFTAECPDSGGTLVYEGYPRGDGIFEENERPHFLGQSVAHILQHCL